MGTEGLRGGDWQFEEVCLRPLLVISLLGLASPSFGITVSSLFVPLVYVSMFISLRSPSLMAHTITVWVLSLYLLVNLYYF